MGLIQPRRVAILPIMTTTSTSYLAGRLLVAMPGIGDPRFERAVILLCEHDRTHAMGLTVNRPVEGLTIADLLGRLGVVAGPGAPAELVLMGGPVEPERGFVLHTRDSSPGPEGLTVNGDLMLTASREILEVLAGADRRPRRAAMAVGYAGWDAGQLEREIRDSVWLTCEADEGLVFDDDHEHKWSRALAKIGVSPEHLSAQPGRA
jgi:putative transcriptional regulator